MEKSDKKENRQPPNKEKAVFKLLIYFKNGSARTFYNYHTSYNAELKKVIECEKTALKKLEKLLLWKFRDTYKTALIIHRPTNEILLKYCYGNLLFVAPYSFTYRDGKIILVPENKLRKIA